MLCEPLGSKRVVEEELEEGRGARVRADLGLLFKGSLLQGLIFKGSDLEEGGGAHGPHVDGLGPIGQQVRGRQQGVSGEKGVRRLETGDNLQ